MQFEVNISRQYKCHNRQVKQNDAGFCIFPKLPPPGVWAVWLDRSMSLLVPMKTRPF